jgi:hypothetical protein
MPVPSFILSYSLMFSMNSLTSLFGIPFLMVRLFFFYSNFSLDILAAFSITVSLRVGMLDPKPKLVFFVGFSFNYPYVDCH